MRVEVIMWGRKGGDLATFHEVFAKGVAVVYFVSVASADAETREVLVEVDKQHLRAHRINPSRGNVHRAQIQVRV